MVQGDQEMIAASLADPANIMRKQHLLCHVMCTWPATGLGGKLCGCITCETPQPRTFGTFKPGYHVQIIPTPLRLSWQMDGTRQDVSVLVLACHTT